MTIIKLEPPNMAHATHIDPGACGVHIRQTTSPIVFESTVSADRLYVYERDGAFVIRHTSGFGDNAFDSGDLEMRKGVLKRLTNGSERASTPG